MAKMADAVSVKDAVYRLQHFLLEGASHEAQLLAAGSIMSRSDYEDLVTERTIGNLCGYPLCSNSLPSDRPRNGRYRISLKEHKVYDLHETYMYCSSGCVVSSRTFAGSLQEERCSVLNPEKLDEVLKLFEGSSPESKVDLEIDLEVVCDFSLHLDLEIDLNSFQNSDMGKVLSQMKTSIIRPIRVSGTACLEAVEIIERQRGSKTLEKLRKQRNGGPQLKLHAARSSRVSTVKNIPTTSDDSVFSGPGIGLAGPTRCQSSGGNKDIQEMCSAAWKIKLEKQREEARRKIDSMTNTARFSDNMDAMEDFANLIGAGSMITSFERSSAG